METLMIKGSYGTGTPCYIITATHDAYTCGQLRCTWYAVRGSHNVNKTYDTLHGGVNVEELHDVDYVHSHYPILSEDDLLSAISGEDLSETAAIAAACHGACRAGGLLRSAVSPTGD